MGTQVTTKQKLSEDLSCRQLFYFWNIKVTVPRVPDWERRRNFVFLGTVPSHFPVKLDFISPAALPLYLR